MLTALLLQAAPSPFPPLLLAGLSWPASPGEWLLWLIASAAALEKIYGWAFGGTSKRLEKLEEKVSSFVPEDNIKAENKRLGEEIADNQRKIKAYHDANESSYNAMEMRVRSLEQHNVNLTLLPDQLHTLKTEHAVLASEVRTLSGSVGALSRKQDSHFMKLMNAVQGLAYTRGQLNPSQHLPEPFELPDSDT